MPPRMVYVIDKRREMKLAFCTMQFHQCKSILNIIIAEHQTCPFLH